MLLKFKVLPITKVSVLVTSDNPFITMPGVQLERGRGEHCEDRSVSLMKLMVERNISLLPLL